MVGATFPVSTTPQGPHPAPNHLSRRVRVGHQQRHRPHRHPVNLSVVAVVHQPAVQYPGGARRSAAWQTTVESTPITGGAPTCRNGFHR